MRPDPEVPPRPTPRPGRDPGLDALKGLLLGAVIIGHFPTSRLGTHPFGPLPEWIYFIHIPLFLALSCLFARPFTFRQPTQRALQLLVPYAFWVALEQPSSLLRHPLERLGDAAMGNWSHLRSVLWFLPALFTTNLLLALWRKDPRPWTPARGALALPAGMALAFAHGLAIRHARIPFGVDVAFFLLPFILVVDLVWRRRGPLAEAAGRFLAPAALAALILGGVLVRTFEAVKTHSEFARRVDFAQFSVPETFAGYFGLCLMGVALLLLAGHLPFQRALAAAGRYGMPIFLLHYPLLYLLTRSIGVARESRVALLAYGTVVTLLVVLLSMGIARTLTRLDPRFALLGLGAPPS